jgi:selenocysteine-specific elongation factor
VLLNFLESERQGLPHWTPVQLHHGAGQTDGRIVLLERDLLQPGETCLAQLVIDQAQPFRFCDRVILRDTSAQRTIAGARVLDPSAPDRHRRRPERLAMLRALASIPQCEALRRLLALPPFLLSQNVLLRDWGLTGRGLKSLAMDLSHLEGGSEVFLATAEALEELTPTLTSALVAFHEKEPILPGMTAEALRISLPVRMSRPSFKALLSHAITVGAIISDENLLHAPRHKARVPDDLLRLRTRVHELLSASPFRPPRVSDLAKAAPAPEPAVRKMCKQLARGGAIIEVAPDHFFLRSAVLDMARAAALLSADTGGAFTAAQFRDRLGNGRQLAIQILDYLDRRGITLRKGDTRGLGKQPEKALGNSASSW